MIERSLRSWIADERVRVGDGSTRQTSVLHMTGHRASGLAVLIATASLFGVFAGHVQATVPSRTLSESLGPHAGGANLEKHSIRLAAAPVPKVSVPAPRLHMSTGTHVNTGNVHPSIGVNSSAVKIRGTTSLKTTSAHQFDKSNGGKGKGGTTKGGNGGFFLKLDGIQGESMDDAGRGHSPDIQ